MLYRIYRALSHLAAPFMPLLIALRLRQGKEDRLRSRERFGISALARPEDALLWFHAASVGEALSIVPLLLRLKEKLPAAHFLVTTVTVTSARLLAERLPAGFTHQYAPLDTPGAVARFFAHWRPDAACFTESELWPNLIFEAKKSGVTLMLVNGRMSARSFKLWNYFSGFAHSLLSAFTLTLAQSEQDAQRLRALGAPDVRFLGNLKHDVPALPADDTALAALGQSLAGRPVWLAASTHPGEEEIIFDLHVKLRAQHAGLLTIVAPRHPERGEAIAALAMGRGLKAAQRSREDNITPAHDIYIADTLGELGLFYRACPIAFIGGSLVAHGGQNLVEAARLGCAIVCGPHMENFADTLKHYLAHEACIQINDAVALHASLTYLLTRPDETAALGEKARTLTTHYQGLTDGIAAEMLYRIREYGNSGRRESKL